MKQNVLLVVESSYKMDERTVSKDLLFHNRDIGVLKST